MYVWMVELMMIGMTKGEEAERETGGRSGESRRRVNDNARSRAKWHNE